VTIHDSLAATTTQSYTVTIHAAPAIATNSLPTGTLNRPYPAVSVSVSNGTAPYAWSATGMPAGLSINGVTGAITGTPTATGTFTPSFTVTDTTGATDSKSITLKVNAAPTVSSVQLANGSGGNKPGKVEQGDQIIVTFSQQMSVSSMCSAWSGDTTDQTINANNNVVVTLADGTGATNDSLMLTSTSCTFHFGSINLGSNAYVSGGGLTFSGSGNKASTIAWSASTNTLTITLGQASGPGNIATVASSTPVYAVDGSITDSNGAAVSNSPFTLPTGQQF
jgi:hypothetical protein